MERLIEWNRVTWYSRVLALVIFLGLIPVISFYIGGEYQKTIKYLEEVSTFTNYGA